MILRKLAAVVLCCSLLSLSSAAQQAGLQVQGSGTVKINGQTLTDSSALMAGDTVETVGQSSAYMVAHGLSLNLGPDSRIVVREGAIEFSRGWLVVTTNAPGWQIRVGGASIVPTSSTAKINVSTKEDVVLIRLLEGSAELKEGIQTTALKAGFTVARPLATGGPATVPVEEKKSSKAPLIAVAAGGAVVGIIFAARGKGESRQPVSPVQP